ncbi:hypothetical protein C8R44DRAFT_894960 [Mycena epipterygia]|nr:hypothetical protein C8R44DRAFT_894960 [Mycena epipterygia]
MAPQLVGPALPVGIPLVGAAEQIEVETVAAIDPDDDLYVALSDDTAILLQQSHSKIEVYTPLPVPRKRSPPVTRPYDSAPPGARIAQLSVPQRKGALHTTRAPDTTSGSQPRRGEHPPFLAPQTRLLVILAHNAVLLRCSALHPHPRVRYPFASAPRITYPPALSYDACPSWISHTKAHPHAPHESRCTIPTRKMSTRAKLDGSSRAHTRRLRLGPHTHPARVSRTIHTHPPREPRPIRAHTSSWTPSSLMLSFPLLLHQHHLRHRKFDAPLAVPCQRRHTIISSFSCTSDCRPSTRRTPSTRAARASSDEGISARTMQRTTALALLTGQASRCPLSGHAPAKRELDVKPGFARLRTSCGPPNLTASVRRIASPRMHPQKAHLRISGRVRCPDPYASSSAVRIRVTSATNEVE